MHMIYNYGLILLLNNLSQLSFLQMYGCLSVDLEKLMI